MYPVLRQVDHSIVSRWGLATLSGLLLGGASCTPAHADQPPPGEPPAVRVEKKPDGKAVRLPDAGAPAETTVVHMGKPTVPRVDEHKAKADKSADKKADKKANKKDPKAGKKEHADVAGTGSPRGSADAAAKPDKPTDEPGDKPRMMGKMRMPRPDEMAPEEKQKAPEK